MLALFLGAVFALDGALKIAAARLIRFPGWKVAQVAGLLSLVLAIGTLQPWPTWYVGTIGVNVGFAFVVSGLGTLALAWRVKNRPAGVSMAALLSPSTARWTPPPGPFEPGEMTVHVWTPARDADPTIRRPIVDRYIAAVDAEGGVATGHAALELPPDLYVSHYPAAELDYSPDEFRRALRATAENDVPGRFLPSYAEEVAGWREANAHVRFRQVDAHRLRSFWAEYRRDTTYNLTKRNCSTAVALALDVALEGRLARHRHVWTAIVVALFSPELWVASLLRGRAATMTWTPGLVLDYARALSAVVEPANVGALRTIRAAWRRRNRHRRAEGRTVTWG
jgi:hypothetical protein